jgi:hypothetical protein
LRRLLQLAAQCGATGWRACDIGAFEYGSYPDWIFADGFD